MATWSEIAEETVLAHDKTKAKLECGEAIRRVSHSKVIIAVSMSAQLLPPPPRVGFDVEAVLDWLGGGLTGFDS